MLVVSDVMDGGGGRGWDCETDFVVLFDTSLIFHSMQFCFMSIYGESYEYYYLCNGSECTVWGAYICSAVKPL